MHYLLFYEKVSEHAEREPPFQTAHRDHVFAAVARGELVLGGPLRDSARRLERALVSSRISRGGRVVCRARSVRDGRRGLSLAGAPVAHRRRQRGSVSAAAMTERQRFRCRNDREAAIPLPQ